MSGVLPDAAQTRYAVLIVAPAGAAGRTIVELADTEQVAVMNDVLALYVPNRPWNVWTDVGITA
ncbi:MAG: hypothetical protein IIB04_01700 [Acidobacteria bacterium]|nr:hypothetical protein [Acidobacteriota bacterium]